MASPSTANAVVSVAKAEEQTPNLEQRIVWIDCEMTGLMPSIHQICEIAVIITEGDLTEVAQFDPVIIGLTPEVEKKMSKWCKTTFRKNGLLEKMRASEVRIETVEEQLVAFLQKHTLKGKSPLGGNSVYMDRMFIQKEMPRVTDHLHYRNVDVSTFKECAARWYPPGFLSPPVKRNCHRSIDDIRESIEELRYFREHVFIPPPSQEPV